MLSGLDAFDPTYWVILLVGLVGLVAFVLETLVFDFHPDALFFVGAFGLLLVGVAALAVDPALDVDATRYLYHGFGVMGTGLSMFLLAFGRRRALARSGAEGSGTSVVGDGGVE